jgi:hypothetical protein
MRTQWIAMKPAGGERQIEEGGMGDVFAHRWLQ